MERPIIGRIEQLTFCPHNQKSPVDSGQDFFKRQNEINDDVLKRLDALDGDIRILSASIAGVWGFLIDDDLATSAELEALATNALTVMDEEGTSDPRSLFEDPNNSPVESKFDREEFERLVKPLVEFLQTQHKKCTPHSWIIVRPNGAAFMSESSWFPFKVQDSGIACREN